MSLHTVFKKALISILPVLSIGLAAQPSQAADNIGFIYVSPIGDAGWTLIGTLILYVTFNDIVRNFFSGS